MNRRRLTTALLGTAVTLVLSTGLPGAAVASNTKDMKTVADGCSRSADYTLRLSDTGGNYDEVQVKLRVDSKFDDRDWDVYISRNGKQIRNLDATTGDNGNFTVKTSIVADDDAVIRVRAKASYGESCDTSTRLATAS